MVYPYWGQLDALSLRYNIKNDLADAVQSLCTQEITTIL